ncbi:MAG: isoprenylcysteine carboxylmethyltransferase family protein [Oscillospiraceae bacterium]|nr:isoprenylcysteine carboxylmethyltransferase family protein [Oscillospiraceae bacterium]
MGLLLLAAFFFIRFWVLAQLDQEAVKRAAYFAPLQGVEKGAYWVYQLSNTVLLVCIGVFPLRWLPLWIFCTGLFVSLAGLAMLLWAVFSFAAPAENGIRQTGIYRLSRNPMYLAYFIFFLGCAILAQSLILLILLLVFQIASHFIILSEERWCTEKFGEAYRQYMKKVRRYL